MPESEVVASLRQQQLLQHAGDAATAAAGRIADGPWELAAADLRCATRALGEVLGHEVTAETIAEIFSRFCVGK
jgi:tRNA U34 5-carboxymethylaminomethyl modifying GTPase MnmE/TrmE